MTNKMHATILTRIPVELAEELKMTAAIDGESMSTFIRMAVANWIAMRHADLAFQARLRERIEKDARILDRLGDSG